MYEFVCVCVCVSDDPAFHESPAASQVRLDKAEAFWGWNTPKGGLVVNSTTSPAVPMGVNPKSIRSGVPKAVW